MSELTVYGKGEFSCRHIFNKPRSKTMKKLGIGKDYKKMQSKKRKCSRAAWMGKKKKGV